MTIHEIFVEEMKNFILLSVATLSFQNPMDRSGLVVWKQHHMRLQFAKDAFSDFALSNEYLPCTYSLAHLFACMANCRGWKSLGAVCPLQDPVWACSYRLQITSNRSCTNTIFLKSVLLMRWSCCLCFFLCWILAPLSLDKIALLLFILIGRQELLNIGTLLVPSIYYVTWHKRDPKRIIDPSIEIARVVGRRQIVFGTWPWPSCVDAIVP